MRSVCPATTTTYELRVVAPGQELKRTVTIAIAGVQEPTINFWAERTELKAGECTNLHWDVENAQEIYFDGQAASSHEVRPLCPSATKIYELKVIAQGQEFKRTVTISVEGTPMINFWAEQTQIKAGECTNLHWDVENAQEIYLDGQGVTGHEVRNVCPAAKTTYELRVIAQGQEFKHTVTIAIEGVQEPTVNFWAERTELNAGECTNLHWDVENVQAVYLDGQGVGGHEVRPVCPAQTTTYELKVVAPGQEIRRTVTIAVLTAEPSPEENLVPIPNVIGLTPEDAQQRLKDAGFESLIGEDGYSQAISRGLIYKQAPGAGELHDPKSTTVIIYRSLGQPPTD